MTSNLTQISKFLSYILRHHPESIGLEVDRRGWAHLPSLLQKSRAKNKQIDRDKILKLIDKSTKQRFSLSKDHQYIRAGYGHSIDVDLGLEPSCPPEILYHGTAKKDLVSIKKSGLTPQNRKMVHLSDNKQDAVAVGGRHGKPHVLKIRALKMYAGGIPFYQSDSEPAIWLVEQVPPDFIFEE